MDANEPENKKSGFSFGFTKKQESRQLSKSVVSENVGQETNEKDFVLSLEGREVKSTKSSDKQTKQEYVIPLIKRNKWRGNADDKDGPVSVTNKIDSNKEDSNKDTQQKSLDELAAQEIINDTKRYNEDWEERGKDDSIVAIPLLMQNKVPEGYELEDKLDVALRPDEPHDADYEQIPIEHFGMAMLRGMGWSETRGIGKNGKVIAPMEAQLRPKGLGLGADRSNSGKDKNASAQDAAGNEKEELELKKNACCIVTGGVNKDLYGTVEGTDEDNARVMVKLSLSGKVVNIMQCHIRVVGKKEFEKYSKYLNKQKADKYKEEEEKRMINGHAQNGDDVDEYKKKSRKRDRRKSESDSDNGVSKHKSRKHKKHREEDRESHRSKHKSKHNKHDRKHDRDSKHPKSSSGAKNYRDDSESVSEDDVSKSSNSPPWLRNDLRVRIIDKNLKRGKYYKEKVIIVDVPKPGVCVCKTDDGKVIDEVPQSALETVIPRLDSSYVAIVSGTDRGQIGKVMKRDKDKCMALVQLLSDRDTVLPLLFDEICEYVGEVQYHEDY